MPNWHKKVQITERQLSHLESLFECIEATPNGDGFGQEPEIANALMNVIIRNGAADGTIAYSDFAETVDEVGYRTVRFTFDVESCFVDSLRTAISDYKRSKEQTQT